MEWWKRGEWADAIGDYQASPDFREASGGMDLFAADASVYAMEHTPLGEPPVDFDVRCVYDSRPVNGYDFNYSISTPAVSTGSWTVQFIVPNGYRAVPREWEIQFDSPFAGPSANSTVSIQQNGAQLPNNGPITIGMGTDEPIKTFFVCEENTTFGITGLNTNITGETNANINVYGNLLPVTDVALQFAIANRKYGT